jgi:Zn-finger nucleic acid-binding protein
VTDAVALVCPSCGAGVTSGARRCVHCDAPLATVRCAACFQMNAREAIHCGGCGRDLGLEPIPRDGMLPCPDCKSPMSALDCGPGAVHDCGRCGGQFVEVAALRDLLERHTQDAGVVRPPGSGRSAADPVRYVACPVCRALMNRHNFGGASGVIVDVCAKHGTWFDRGELPRVLAFVESGGLARRRALDEEEHRRRVQERAASAAVAHQRPTFGGDGEVDRLGGSLVADLLSALFGD